MNSKTEDCCNSNNNDLSPTKNLRQDFLAGIAVFLVALPLCLGIALASGAPITSGIMAGIVGGIVVGIFSGSALGVSGPAAGLVVLTYNGIEQMTFPVFLLSVMFAGVVQIVLGKLRAGIIGYYFPSAVISGMLVGIGLIIILKQIPHAVGYDRDYEGDMDFSQPDGYTTFSELDHMVNFISPSAIVVALVSLAILILWETPFIKRFRFSRLLPASLLAVVSGVVINQVFELFLPDFALSAKHLVSIPIGDSGLGFFSHLVYPDFSQLHNTAVYSTGLIIAVVASLETLLCLEATDKLDPHKRITSTNRELVAQGIGNIASGLVGGIPITQVVVRSSANIQAKARTKASTIIHGGLLFLAVLLIPHWINLIPLASLAALLLMVGYKLSHPRNMIKMYRSGPYHFIPFIATVLGLVFTDLLTGITIGMAIAMGSILLENYRMGMYFHKKQRDNKTIIHLAEHVSFLNKANLLQMLNHQPPRSELIIDATGAKFIDYDVREIIENFKIEARDKKIDFKLIEMPEYHVVSKVIQQGMTPDEALELLKEGNQRFVNNLRTRHDLLSQVNITSAGQFPFAIMLSCIDSRTSAELIFDLGLGDIFSARIAGNVVNPDIIGSMEFACSIAGSKLIVVLGHSHCGAIKGACSGVELENLTGLLDKIKPSVVKVRQDHGDLPEDVFANHVATENVRQTTRRILADSHTLRYLYDQKKIGIVGGMYDIETGEVKFFEP
ncbi:MAG: bifunctional SulP family inorganic anion transporter/carbonic anhydrase [Gammaproteobacteria bacterium]